MNSIVTADFIDCFSKLPAEVRQLARRSYRLWRANPNHRSLRFRKIQGHDDIYSVRVGRSWRALGRLHDGTIIWFWIGSHAEYDGLIG